MSYEIIYELFTIKKEDKFIPFIVIGSNNCTEFHRGRERRERNLHKVGWLLFKNQEEFNSVEEMKEKFDYEATKHYIQSGSLQGKFKTPDSMVFLVFHVVFMVKLINMYFMQCYYQLLWELQVY